MLITISLRKIIRVASQLTLDIHRIDIKTVFLNGDLDQFIYIVQPAYFKDTNHPDFALSIEVNLIWIKAIP